MTITNTPATGTETNFKPTYWSAAMMHNYYEVSAIPLITKRAPKINGTSLVYNLATPVQIKTRKTGDVTTENNTISWQTVTPVPITIDMDDLAEWAIQFTDLELFQTNIDLLNAEMQEASMGMDEEISSDVYADMYTSAKLTLGSITVSPLNAYDYIVDMATQLNINKVPKKGRYVMIDYIYLGMLSKDPRFTWKPEVLAKGIVEGAEISGLRILVSNELPILETGGANGIYAGIPDAYGFGMQFDKLKYYPQFENSWNEGVKGRGLYGKGVLRPECLINAQVTYDTKLQPDIVD